MGRFYINIEIYKDYIQKKGPPQTCTTILLILGMHLGCLGIINNVVNVGPLYTFLSILGQCIPVDLRCYC